MQDLYKAGFMLIQQAEDRYTDKLKLNCDPDVEKPPGEIIGNSKHIGQSFLITYCTDPLVRSLVIEAEQVKNFEAEPGIPDKIFFYGPFAIFVGDKRFG